jgi:DHA1 family bicyclomycin/chloramphenicol resistance-like MFS transporter
LGLCAGGCFSASVAVIRDIYAEDKMNRVIGYMFSFCGFFSVLCGVIGGYLAAQYGWRGNFTALFVIASYLLVSIFLLLPETRPESTRISGFEEWKRKTGILLKDRNFLRYLLSGSFIYTTMLVFISAVAFVLDGLFQVDAQTLGICFSVMVLGYSVGAILSSVLKADQMRDRTLTIILTLPMIAISALPFYEYIPLNGAYYIACLFFIVDLVVGFYGPVTTTRITGPYPHLSGTAASLVACCAMILGALSGFIATHFYDGTIWPMMVTMLATSAAALAAFLIFAPRIDHKNVPAF